jgi:hypothetical protein
VLKSDFERLVQTRIREARLLLAGAEFDGCYYLTGYAVEAALKACIAKATRRFEFPDKDRANRVFTPRPGKIAARGTPGGGHAGGNGRSSGKMGCCIGMDG